MLVSGVFYGALGSVVGLVIYAILCPLTNHRVTTLEFFLPENLAISLTLAVMVGAIPAFATGMAAVPLCRGVQPFWLSVLAIVATGATATALYVSVLGLDPMDKFGAPVMACGVGAAFVCALASRKILSPLSLSGR